MLHKVIKETICTRLMLAILSIYLTTLPLSTAQTM